MVLNSRHHVGVQLRVGGGIAKGGSSRTIPLRSDLATALRRLRRQQGQPRDGPVIVSERGSHRSLTTTERYIQGDRAAQRKLIARL